MVPRLQRVFELRICPGELDSARSHPGFADADPVDRTTWYRAVAERTTRPFYGNVTELVEGRLHVASVYLPGAERFFLAEHGVEVAPTGADPLAPALRLR